MKALGEWRHNSTHSEPWDYMKTSGQLHAPAVLTPGKHPLPGKVLPCRESNPVRTARSLAITLTHKINDDKIY